MTTANPTAPPTRVTPARAFGTDKIHPRHLDRAALVYVRQSSPQQVLQHRESTDLQYKLTERAEALGWSPDRVVVIDDDLGRSGRTIDGRDGFRRLLAEVALDRVGLVLGIEMSRLARSCKDWYHLLELCARFGTLLADQDGLYDPSHYNDRLLLGLKGTMSEAELHVLHQRMREGILNKARRGELFSHPPIGYVREPLGGVALDPDEQVRQTVATVFDLFAELGTVNAVVRYLRRQEIRVGVRPHCGPDRGRLVWRDACLGTVRNILRHPMYAGAYAYGRFRADARRPDGHAKGRRWEADPAEWVVLLKDRLPAYITWDRFEGNRRRLADNQARATRPGAPRDGAALLGGLLRCPRCGGRMSASYGGPKRDFRYSCDKNGVKHGGRGCQSIGGSVVDAAVATELLRALEPAALELSCQAAEAARHEDERLHRHWRQRLDRAGYDVDLARRRYEAVDPDNRLVARTLEAQWEAGLRHQQAEQAAYDAFVAERPQGLTADQRDAILALADSIPVLWHADTTRPSERQEIVRLLIDRVVLHVPGGADRFEAVIGWKGGLETRVAGRRRVHRVEQLTDYDRVVARAEELRRTGHSDRRVAAILNAEGHSPPLGRNGFTKHIVNALLSRSEVPAKPVRRTCHAEALGRDEWWLTNLATELAMPYVSLHAWIGRGWVVARKVADAAGMQAVWADRRELDRLRRLRDHRRDHPYAPPPAQLVTPRRAK
jgi:DNA invertase Pin-like site-specific DNA recombinase